MTSEQPRSPSRTVSTSPDGTHTHGYIPGTGTLANLTTGGTGGTILTRTLYHDRMGRLFGIVTANAAGAHLSRHGYTLDKAGRRTRATRENGQRWDYGYDDVGQVTSGAKSFPNGDPIPGHSFSYQYDGIGNRTSVTHGGANTAITYTPNALNQYEEIETEGGRFILGEAPPADPVIINGDTQNPAERPGGLGFYWKQITADNSAGPLWSTDTVESNGVTLTGHAWTPAASVAPEYDSDGNLTNDGRWDYLWDAENRLIRMTTTFAAAAAGVPRQRLDFVYDSQGRRVSKSVSTSPDGTTWTLATDRRFLYDGWNLIAEYSAPSETSTTLTHEASYLWGLDLSGTPQGAGGVGGLLAVRLLSSVSESSVYPAYDGNGNVSAWIGGTGTLLARMDYSPFGQLIAHHKFTTDATLSRLPFGFSTKYADPETGLLYYGHRYYDPVHGRWQSRDPIEEEGGVNLYGFVGNDGMNWWDVLGNIPNPNVNPNSPLPLFHRIAHQAGTAGLLQGETELLDSRANGTAQSLVPREYGGRICEKCLVNGNQLTFSWYATTEPGFPRSAAGAGNLGKWTPTEGSKCDIPDTEVAFWHSHPSELCFYRKGRTEYWFWSKGASFSTGDYNVVDGLRDRVTNRVTTGTVDNPKHLPLFVTYRTEFKRLDGPEPLNGIRTDLYLAMPKRIPGITAPVVYGPQPQG